MELSTVYANIEQVYNIKREQYDLMNPRFCKNANNQITWLNHISNEKFDSYEEYYFWVNENLQYSFLLNEDSFVQFFFEGEKVGKKIEVYRGSMAYLPNPYTYSEYFRFDMDLKNEKDYKHVSYHVHFGYRAKDVRFALYKYPLPSEFLKLIQFLHYDISLTKFSQNKFWESLSDRNIAFNHCLDLK